MLAANSKQSISQATFANNAPGANRFLGFNGAQNLEFRTNNITRMQLMQSGNSLINGYTINRSGFLGLSVAPTFFTNHAPYSILHLNGVNPNGIPEFNGYRSWMQYGIISTHNQDLMFIGQRRIADDITNATIAWADNSIGSQDGPDNLTFVHTAGNGLAPSGSTSDGGLEVARMTTVGHTGIGTLWSNSLQPVRTLDVVRKDGEPQFRITYSQNSSPNSGFNTDFQNSQNGDLHIMSRSNGTNRNVAIGYLHPTSTPTERLDVLGTARLRQMPNNEPNVLITGVQQNQAGDYALNYLAFPNDGNLFLAGDGTWVPGNVACDWNLVTNGASNDLVMGYAGACNEGRVGIGTSNPFAKLNVQSNLPPGTGNFGVLSSATGGSIIFSVAASATADQSTTQVSAVHGHAIGLVDTQFTTGVYGEARDGQYVVGVHGLAVNGNPVTGTTVGVAGRAPQASLPGQSITGVYAESPNIALYYAGTTIGTGPVYTISDESFKQGITDEVPGIETLLQIQPKSYEFRTEEFGFMNLASGTQYGILAQELQELLPNLVREASKPEIADPESGEILSPGMDHLAVNYDGLIPVLIKSVQEQQAMITAQQAQIEALVEMVNNCCAQGEAPKSNSSDNGLGYDLKIQEPTLEQNVPNPFSEQTQIRYTLPEPASIQLVVYNQQGQLIETLANGNMPAGEYQVRWNGSHLPSGTYLYVLSVNGQDLVKRAVKMN